VERQPGRAGAPWQREGKPRGVAWDRLAEPLWSQLEQIEERLAPVLFEWAEAEGLTGRTYFGYWHTEYAKVRKATGIKMNGHRMKGLIGYGARKKALSEMARSMTKTEWAEYEANFCTTTQEGKNTLAVMQDARRR
jgi:hypothetical protein